MHMSSSGLRHTDLVCSTRRACPVARRASSTPIRSHKPLRQHLTGTQLAPHSGPRHPWSGALHKPARLQAAAEYREGDSVSSQLSSWQRFSIFNTTYDAEIVSLALPALASMLLEPVMGAINTGLVAHLGTPSLAAVSIGSMSVSFAILVFSFMLFLTTPRIAAAVAANDLDKVSKTSSASLWISAVCGIITSIALYFFAPNIMAVFNPPEAVVAQQATTYIRTRALGVIAALSILTCSGIYRGFKDTRTPLYASVATAAASLFLNIILIYGLQLGVMGAAMATSIAQWVSFATLLGMLIKGGRVRVPDLMQPPPLTEVLPVLRSGALLSGRTIVSFGLVLYASTLCVRAGSTVQGAFEVVRQLWIMTIQFFECLNVASQAMCSAYLGGQDWKQARVVLSRITFLGSITGVAVGLGLLASMSPVVNLFTHDHQVVAEVVRTLPMMCFFFPIDAIASIMDGGLFAAQQSDFLTYVQIGGALVQYAILMYVVAHGTVDSLTIWSTLKVMTVLRLACGVFRNFVSAKSGFRAAPAAALPELWS